MHNFVKMFTRQWKLLLTAGVLVALLSLGVSLIAPLEYRADTEILILSLKQSGTDPLATSRAQERIAEQLALAVETDAFFEQVQGSGGLSDELRAMFPDDDPRKRRKRWQKSVDASALFGTSILTVSAYNTDREEAELLASQVAETVFKNGSEYVGTPIVARVVNESIASVWPVRPNLLINTALGFIVGIIGMGWLLVRRSRSGIFG